MKMCSLKMMTKDLVVDVSVYVWRLGSRRSSCKQLTEVGVLSTTLLSTPNTEPCKIDLGGHQNLHLRRENCQLIS